LPGEEFWLLSRLFFIFFNITFLLLVDQYFGDSKIVHPNSYKGLKAWVALHAVPHGGMTNERTKK
tara:strand:+ start:5785 stop:5979 length:195 start_codon:yes stop_codon:yes gene_type:complete